LSWRTASFSRRPLILAGWTEMNMNTRTMPTSSSLSTMLHIRKKAIADSCDDFRQSATGWELKKQNVTTLELFSRCISMGEFLCRSRDHHGLRFTTLDV
jgi:hypothetical protein